MEFSDDLLLLDRSNILLNRGFPTVQSNFETSVKALHHVRGSGELRIPQNFVKVVPEPYRIGGRHPHLIVHGDCTKVSLLEIINHTHQLWVVALNVESYFVEGLLNVSHRDKSKKHRQPCGSSKYLILEILNLKLLMYLCSSEQTGRGERSSCQLSTLADYPEKHS